MTRCLSHGRRREGGPQQANMSQIASLVAAGVPEPATAPVRCGEVVHHLALQIHRVEPTADHRANEEHHKRQVDKKAMTRIRHEIQANRLGAATPLQQPGRRL